MEFTIFYAWQSDTDAEVNRFFIRDALKRAIQMLRTDATVTERPALDHDTRGVAGTPDIFTTILEKIGSCGIFLGDVTPVASTTGRDGKQKRIPNPNVMLEAGYAFSRVGDRRVLLILNDAIGTPDELPFDLSRRRWPLTYTMAPGNAPTKADEKALAEKLRTAIRAVIESGPVVNIDEGALRKLRSVFFDPNSAAVNVNDTASEFMLVLDPLPLALFTFMESLPNPHVVCSNAAERSFVDRFCLDYPRFRRSANELDACTVNKVGDLMKPHDYVPFWRIISYYTILVAEGHPESDVLWASQNKNISHNGDDCRRIAPQVISDNEFAERHKTARALRDGVRALLAEVRSKSLFGIGEEKS